MDLNGKRIRAPGLGGERQIEMPLPDMAPGAEEIVNGIDTHRWGSLMSRYSALSGGLTQIACAAVAITAGHGDGGLRTAAGRAG
ncbi:hypothetical protein GCM10007973_20070 [Polymorphobacter multimanifer]|nr:hypothetical protein GCM10007973_20070 [Polymorphobacter multimanifer]